MFAIRTRRTRQLRLRTRAGHPAPDERTYALCRSRGAERDLQAAEFRPGKIEAPAISIENILDDGQPEAGAFAALVEASGALEHARQLGGGDPGAVVLDDDRWPGGCADADAPGGVARGILKQVAEHLGKIGAVERHLQVVGN